MALLRKNILIIIILSLAAFLRMYRLESVPIAPYWEEAALGYDAYSIAQTGKDHHGNAYPIIAFPSFGDYKPSGYFYALVPFIKAFGLSVMAVRLPSAIAGTLSVLLVFFLTKELFDKKTALLASALYALQPWAIQFSRGGWEVNLSVTLILLGVYLLLQSRKNQLFFPFAALFFALSMYTYHAARLFAPLAGIFVGLSVLIWQHKRSSIQWRSVLLGGVLAILLVSPLFLRIGQKEVSSRFWDTTVLTSIEPILASNAAIANAGSTRFAKIVFHRYWYFSSLLLRQWASHFHPTFLFVRGDGNLRHSNGFVGNLYPLEIFPLITVLAYTLFSAYKSIFKKDNSSHLKKVLSILFWIVLSAVPPALVSPAPHGLRFLYASPAFAILAAFGWRQLYELCMGRCKTLLFSTVLLLYFSWVGGYLYWYFVWYPIRSAADWQYGYGELFEKINSIKKSGERVFVSREYGRPAMYYLFYSKADPLAIQSVDAQIPKDQLELLSVGVYDFGMAVEPSRQGILALPGVAAPDPQAILVGSVQDFDTKTVWSIWRR